jgi:hypothetical protein
MWTDVPLEQGETVMQRSVANIPVGRRRAIPDVPALGGAVAGFLAGAVMVLLSPLLSLITNVNIWVPPKLIAATMPWIDGATATQPGFDLVPVLTGTLIHFAVSIMLGALFGLFFRRLRLPSDFGLPVMIGLCYGLIIFGVAFFIALPIINPTLSGSDMGPVIAQNIVFGICLGIFYNIVRPRPYTES